MVGTSASYGQFTEEADLRIEPVEKRVRAAIGDDKDAAVVARAIDGEEVSTEELLEIARKGGENTGRLAIREYYKRSEDKEKIVRELVGGSFDDRYLGFMILQEIEPCDLGWELLSKYSESTITRHKVKNETLSMDIIITDLLAYYIALCNESEPIIYARLYELEWGGVFRQAFSVKICKYYSQYNKNEELLNGLVMECVKREYDSVSLENMLKYAERVGWKEQAVELKRADVHELFELVNGSEYQSQGK
ncbi:MAG: hypothetical protein JXN62_08420 [Bacteroidales bacterium]|nr:hypothetical protein [Bacteroidales bacterium]